MNPIMTIFLITVVLLFVTGFYCLFVTRNLIRILIALEVLTKSVTLLLVIAGQATGQVALAQTFIISLIIVEVVVMAVAAGIVIGIFRHSNSVNSERLGNLEEEEQI